MTEKKGEEEEKKKAACLEREKAKSSVDSRELQWMLTWSPSCPCQLS